MLQLTSVTKSFGRTRALAPVTLEVEPGKTTVLIGPSGYGQPILTGIRLDDVNLILEGAVPAAILALVVQGAFELAGRCSSPRACACARKLSRLSRQSRALGWSGSASPPQAG